MLALFFLSPLVGEWLLGNQPITALPAVLVLAPMYGGGAVLIREITRRAGRGWPTMIVLAAAYALVEEGLIDAMFWNPHYAGIDMASAYAGVRVPVLDTSVALLRDVLSLHTVWSICVPIALVETFAARGRDGGCDRDRDRDRGCTGGDRTRPWLGWFGLALTAVVFGSASVLLAVSQQHSEHFVARPAQFAACAAVIAVLIAVAFTLPASPAPRPYATVPRPWKVGAAAFAATSFYWLSERVLPTWSLTLAWLLLTAGFITLATRWSRSPAWSPAHRLALASGALLTYTWLGFTQASSLDVPLPTALLGNTVFTLAALALLTAAARSLHTRRS